MFYFKEKWKNKKVNDLAEKWLGDWNKLCDSYSQEDERDAELIAMFIEDLEELDEKL